MNYKIINDEAMFRDFISWLPVLKKDECFYMVLMARKKYCKGLPEGVPGISRDKAQLRRFTVADISMMYDKVKQLECELGSYVSERIAIPNEALALYITPNPRNLQKAAKESLIRLANLVTEPYNGYNPHQEVMSITQKSCSRKWVVDFDFDDMDFSKEFSDVLVNCVDTSVVSVVKTRGGFHLLVHTDRLEGHSVKNWYKCISGMGCDVKGDSLLPVVGCCQGGHTPYFLIR